VVSTRLLAKNRDIAHWPVAFDFGPEHMAPGPQHCASPARSVEAVTSSGDSGKPCFSLEALDEVHTYSPQAACFFIENCGQRTARDIRFDPVLSKSGNRVIRFERIASLSPGTKWPLTFHVGIDETVSSLPQSLVVKDFNGDGSLDLASTNYYGGVNLLLGNGDGTFQTPTSYFAGGNNYGLAAVDLNHDGKPDLVTTSAGTPVS
jgi:hypothetical protein